MPLEGFAMKENYGDLKYKALTQEIIGVFYEVYNE